MARNFKKHIKTHRFIVKKKKKSLTTYEMFAKSILFYQEIMLNMAESEIY